MTTYDGWAFKYLDKRNPFLVKKIFYKKSEGIKEYEKMDRGKWKDRDKTWLGLVKIKLVEVFDE